MRRSFLSGTRVRVALTCLLAACFCCSSAYADKNHPMKNVLILFPQEGWYAPATRAIYHAIKSVFDENSKFSVSLFDENIDLHLFRDRTSRRNIADFIKNKYGDTKIDLIIPVTSASLNFLLGLQDSLFPGIPIVYCAEVAHANQRLEHRGDVTGTAVTLDIAGTIELARRLQPGLKRVAVVAGSSLIDEYLLSIFRDVFKGFEGRLELIDLSARPVGVLLDQVGRLPASTCILYLNLRRDVTGRIYSSADTQKRVSQAANVPLFNLFDTSLGYGSVGGRLTQLEVVGLKTGEIALRVLSGESAGSIEPAVIRENPAMFNWREMKRWGIAESSLPPESIVRFKEHSQWEEFRWWVIGTFSFICLQTLLIFLLIHNIFKRRRAEDQSSRDRQNLAHISRVSTVGQLGHSLAHEINQPLAAMRVNAEAAQTLLEGEPPDLAEVRAALGDIVADSKRAQEVVACIRDLVRNKPPDIKPLDLNRVASDAVQMVQTDAASKGAAVHLELAEDLPAVYGDHVQLQQVALNLLLNALESVSENPFPPKLVTVQTDRDGDGCVRLSVSDNGPGIEPVIVKHLFEPFFTTKPEGLGLGLSICRSIIEAHGGSLSADSGLENGAAFRLHLPVGSAAKLKASSGGSKDAG
jgi:signal transduction histidine kinase